MAPYDEWNKLDDDDEDELQDTSVLSLFSPPGGTCADVHDYIVL